MIKQHIDIENKWKLIMYYNVDKNNVGEVMETLSHLNCYIYDAKRVYDLLTTKNNSGITYTNYELKTTFTCISVVTSGEQFFNSVVHEIKHIQSHICKYYEVEEDGEEAAYLCGYIAQKIYKPFIKILKNYL